MWAYTRLHVGDQRVFNVWYYACWEYLLEYWYGYIGPVSSDQIFFIFWWAEVTHGAKNGGSFSEMMGQAYKTKHSCHLLVSAFRTKAEKYNNVHYN